MPESSAPGPGVEVRIAPPPGWFDRTMIVHSAPLQPGQAMAANIVVARDALPADESFADYCARQRAVFADSLPGYTADEERAGVLHDRKAVRMSFAWQSSAGELRQQVSFIDAGKGVVVTFTASAAAADFEAHRDVFNERLAALEIDDGSTAQPAVSE